MISFRVDFQHTSTWHHLSSLLEVVWTTWQMAQCGTFAVKHGDSFILESLGFNSNMFKSADILREASRTARITILPAGLRQRTQQTCQSNSLCYPMSHMHTEKNAPHNGLQQTSTVGEFSWSSLWPNKEIHHLQDLWDCTGLPTSFLTGGSCWPSGSCGWEALRTHGRTPWSSLGDCWNRFRRFNLATNLPSDLCETPPKKCHGCHGLCLGKPNAMRWDLPSLRGAAASPRARSIFDPVPGAVCDREKKQLKTTAPNVVRLHCLKSTTKVQKVWWCLMNINGKMKARTVAGVWRFRTCVLTVLISYSRFAMICMELSLVGCPLPLISKHVSYAQCQLEW